MQNIAFLTALSPELVIFATLLITLASSVLVERQLNGDRALVNFSAYFVIAVIFILLAYLVAFLKFVPSLTSFFLFDHYVFDSFSLFSKLFLLALALPVLVILRAYLVAERIYAYEFFVLFLIALLGMFLMVSCQDFLLFYVALEIQALSFYALAAMRMDSLTSAEAGLKYFIIGVLASLLVLFGIALLYGYTGSTNFHCLALFFNYEGKFPYLPLAGVFCIWIGLLVKLSAAPLHFWSLDVYQGAPLAVMGFFAVLPKVTLVAVFLRLFYSVFSGSWIATSLVQKLDILNYTYQNDSLFRAYWLSYLDFIDPLFVYFWTPAMQPWIASVSGLIEVAFFKLHGDFYPAGPFAANLVNLFLILGLLSIFVGAVGGLSQTNLKRLFAYSSLTNVGFILLTFVGAGLNGFHATVFYTFIYVLLTVSFLILLAIFHVTYRRPIYSINDLSGISLFFAIPMALNLLALAGIPPTAGFAIKFYVYYLLVEAGRYYAAALVVLASVLAIFFYLRLVAILFFARGNVVTLSLSASLPGDLRFVFVFFTMLTNVILVYLLPEVFNFCWTVVFLALH